MRLIACFSIAAWVRARISVMAKGDFLWKIDWKGWFNTWKHCAVLVCSVALGRWAVLKLLATLECLATLNALGCGTDLPRVDIIG